MMWEYHAKVKFSFRLSMQKSNFFLCGWGRLYLATFNNISECRSGSIRLVGGNNTNQGTVEFCIGDSWNTICGYPWDWNETNSLVLCNQLGLKNSSMYVNIIASFQNICFVSGATTYFYSYFGQGSGFTLQLQAACTGTESSVFQCPPKASTYYFQQYTYSCYYHYYDIGIQCFNDNGRICNVKYVSQWK